VHSLGRRVQQPKLGRVEAKEVLDFATLVDPQVLSGYILIFRLYILALLEAVEGGWWRWAIAFP
jgi:hypothetical protein